MGQPSSPRAPFGRPRAFKTISASGASPLPPHPLAILQENIFVSKSNSASSPSVSIQRTFGLSVAEHISWRMPDGAAARKSLASIQLVRVMLWVSLSRPSTMSAEGVDADEDTSFAKTKSNWLHLGSRTVQEPMGEMPKAWLSMEDEVILCPFHFFFVVTTASSALRSALSGFVATRPSGYVPTDRCKFTTAAEKR